MAMKNLDYDYCHAAPVLEWMSQKWALVGCLNTQLSRFFSICIHFFVVATCFDAKHHYLCN